MNESQVHFWGQFFLVVLGSRKKEVCSTSWTVFFFVLKFCFFSFLRVCFESWEGKGEVAGKDIQFSFKIAVIFQA